MNEIVSPLTMTENVILERKISAEEIMKEYAGKFDIDIKYIFGEITEIAIYKCCSTEFRFYHPVSISGDDNFYRHFGRYEWYYLPWKWEHEECARLVKKDDSVLEIGSGRGDFLSRLMSRTGANCVGLELNSEAVREATEKGIPMLHQSIEDHAVTNPNKYDIVCSFQVLEHVAHPHQVLKSMIACLKPGGILIISVPNNDSYIKDNPLPSKILNMPPHHMGLWNENAIKNIGRVFPITHLESKLEPLQPIHSDTYQYTMMKKLLLGSNFLIRAYWKLRIYYLGRIILKIFARFIKGHSIMGVYIKS